MIGVDAYLDFLDQEYLRVYLEQGGAAVKFAVVSEGSAPGLLNGIAEVAGRANYAVATVDAATTRAHLLDRVFFDVARQLDWDALALTTAADAVAVAGYPAPSAGALSLDALAVHHRVDVRELKRDTDRQLQSQVHRDYAMVQEFRTAMLRLCQAQLRTGQVADAEHTAVLDWLRGDLRQISALRSALIFRRIARHNARQMLFSTSHWLAVNGRAGLVLVLDIRRFALSRRPSLAEREGHYYTKAALLDAYEMLRQLVDSTDELNHALVLVVADPTFLTDGARGLDAYQALKLRIFDEVRDLHRDNPFSSLVRLAA